MGSLLTRQIACLSEGRKKPQAENAPGVYASNLIRVTDSAGLEGAKARFPKRAFEARHV